MNSRIIRSDMEEIYNSNLDWSLFEGKTILITGAYGMLASYVTYFFMYLHECKDVNLKLVLMIRSEAKLAKCIGDLNKGYIKPLLGSIEEPICFGDEIDYIIHAASLASPQYYESCPVDVMMPNVVGTYNLLKFAVEKKVRSFLLFSSSDIYGRVDYTDSISEVDYGIMDTLDIHNCYSESKRMAENMCYSFFKQYGVPTKMARIWHTYAPTMNIENDSRVFASFVKNVVNCEDIIMHSDGSGVRSFCYITDAVHAFMRILLLGENGNAYNVCNECQSVSILELAERIISLYPERGIKVVRKCRSNNEKYAENIHLAHKVIVPVSDKLRKLNWEPQVNIEDGFARVVEYIEGELE